jgi:hypothetical protein
MRFIAHTGLPKTGTSAFQEWLYARAQELRPYGIVAPVEILPPHGNFVLVVEALMTPKAQRGPKQADLVKKARELMARPDGSDFLVSSEHLERVVSRSEEIRAFQAGLAEIGAKWDMALTVLRNPIDILNSTYAQNVKNGYYPRSFASFLEFRRENRTNEYDRNITQLRQAGVEVRVIAYRGRASTAPLTEQLMELAGLRDRLPADFDFSVPYINESFGCLAVIAARHVWSLVQHAAPGLPSILQFQFGTILREELSKLDDRPYNGFKPEMRRAAEKHYAASLAALEPDLTPEDFEIVRQSRSAKDPVSPSSWDELDEGERLQIQAKLDRIRARVARNKRLAEYIPKSLDFETQRQRGAKAGNAPKTTDRGEPQIVLHVGSHKSGTTAFQSWMKANSQVLADAGIAVPVWLLGRDGNAPNLAKALAASKRYQAQEDFQLLADFAQFAREVRGRTIFFSAEAFETALVDGGFVNVVDRLRALGLRKQAAVLIVRNQIDALNSEYSQRCKQLTAVRPAGEALDVAFSRGRKNWFLIRNTLHEFGFDPRLGVYRGRDPEMPIARQVMTLAGLAGRFPEDVNFEAETTNESIGELGCIAGQHLIRLLDREGRHATTSERRWVSNLLIEACSEFPDAPYNGFDAESRARVMAHFGESNRRLAPYLKGGEEEIERLMTSRSEGRDKSPETWSDLTPAQRQTVIAMLEVVSDQLDLTRKRRNILPRDQILTSIPGYDGVRMQPITTRRIKMDKDDWLYKEDKPGGQDAPNGAERPLRPNGKPPARANGGARPAKKPAATFVKDPLLQRLTVRRITASLLRRARALFAKT